ncbi:hypothetical protein KC19_12G134200 [Ceratodon purpureus]|uniref:DUF1995 domain-containing protein n=1 Tax=Ceratodon purpureus TaxID=3225 RepID=A0A8T0G7G5_CERPU|nr:hypothetical protein KC19_12G134200 [Ceratodon purpureus]
MPMSLSSTMASSPCLTMSLPSLSPTPTSTRPNSTFFGVRILPENSVPGFSSRTGESFQCPGIRAEGGLVPGVETSTKVTWRGVPTKLNTTPHSREMRQYFYKDVCQAAKNAVSDGQHKLRIQLTIPELNPEMDVYRIGTLLELVRELAFTFADDGKRVRVCVQGAMGEGIFSGMPLALAGTRPMLERMDWGTYIDEGTFIRFGAVGLDYPEPCLITYFPLSFSAVIWTLIEDSFLCTCFLCMPHDFCELILAGAKEVYDDDDMFILMAPQNAVGNCIIDVRHGVFGLEFN